MAYELRDIRSIIRHLKTEQHELDLLILRVPTGEVRNVLADANIILLEMIRELEALC